MLEGHRHHHDRRVFDGIVDNRVERIPWYFTALLYGLVLWGLAYAGYFLLSGWSSQAAFERKMEAFRQAHAQAAPAAVAPIGREAAEALFAQRCAGCHGKDAHGNVGPDLHRDAYRYGRSAEAVGETIRNGRPGGMPAFGTQLSPAQVEGLVRYVLTLH